jgi:hypothetical protein
MLLKVILYLFTGISHILGAKYAFVGYCRIVVVKLSV